MKIVQLDLRGCKCTRDMHDRLSAALDFPSWYGNNWDALYDMLTTEIDANKIIIRGESSLPKSMNDAIKMLHIILDDTNAFHKKIGWDPLTYEIID